MEGGGANRARRQGTTPEMLALDSLRERFVAPTSQEIPAERQETLADFLSGYIGVLHSGEHVPGGARMSEERGKKSAKSTDSWSAHERHR